MLRGLSVLTNRMHLKLRYREDKGDRTRCSEQPVSVRLPRWAVVGWPGLWVNALDQSGCLAEARSASPSGAPAGIGASSSEGTYA